MMIERIDRAGGRERIYLEEALDDIHDERLSVDRHIVRERLLQGEAVETEWARYQWARI